MFRSGKHSVAVSETPIFGIFTILAHNYMES
jgi:hypothetical protein